ncbi:MAG: chemotaxis protein CheW [Proteobacteria bacterium]|uniref:chemotaxis protein CheW n=1 Tax=Rudaea sp. TaxID=2136325 RepID=UPI001DF6838E|nr:chemotaxis protein CheW [Pseudomonadota bacterium]MBS0566957.1 chemotaxis protein CheW [Pseudomonadota bacterium]
MNEALPREIHAVLITIGGARMLLPNAIVAEIVPLAGVEAIEGAPAWLLGSMRWRERTIPLVSLPMLTGTAAQEDAKRARVAVLKTLDGRDELPYFGLISQGLPRLTTITPELLVRTDDGQQLAAGTSAHVLVRSDQAIIPDLNWIEAKVAQALGV